MARRIYNGTPERDGSQEGGTGGHPVGQRAHRARWLSRIDKDSKDARNKRIFDKWLACYTQKEIAAGESISQGDVSARYSKRQLCRRYF